MVIPKGYKQTEVGVIPEDWGIEQLEHFVTIYAGKSPSFYNDGTIPYYKVEQLNYCGKYLSDTPYWVECDKPVPYPCIIFPKRGAAIATNKIRIGQHNLCIDTNLMALVFNESVSIEFLYYWLVRFGLWQIADTTSVPQINNKHIKPIYFPCPSRIEQLKIADTISNFDKLISYLEKLIKKKKAIKQGAMQELLSGNLRLPGFIDKWEAGKWKDVLEGFCSGATPFRGQPEYYNGKVRWVSSGELNYNIINDTLEHISVEAQQTTNLTLHPKGTFLMAITGLEAEGTRGSCAILGKPATTNQSCMAIYGTEKMSTGFLYHYYVLFGNKLALQYCQGTKQQSYTASIVKELPIFYPTDRKEQDKISEILSNMDLEIEVLEQKLEKYRQIKQGMMQQLLTGKIRLV